MVEIAGGVISVLIMIIGALLSHSIGNMNDTVKKLVTEVQSMKSDVKSNDQLRQFQDRRIEKLEHGKEVLTDAFHEVDVILRAKIGQAVKLRRSREEDEE